MHAVLYLLFNEGYLSAHAEQAIRRELCDEAIRLATLLAEHPVGAVPETFALLALMHLHARRLAARVDGTGGLLLLEEQDRVAVGSRTDRGSARSGSRGRPAETCSRAFTPKPASPPSTASRRRSRDPLEGDRRPLRDAGAHRAVAAAHDEPRGRRRRVAGAGGGSRAARGIAPPAWLAGSYLWDAVLGDLHRRAGRSEIAQRHRERALDSAPTDAVRDLLRRRLAAPDWPPEETPPGST